MAVQEASPEGKDFLDSIERFLAQTVLAEDFGLGQEVVERLAAGAVERLPQDPTLATGARRLRKTDGEIDWNRTAVEIKNQLRALEPWPRTSTAWLRPDGAPMRLIPGPQPDEHFVRRGWPGARHVSFFSEPDRPSPTVATTVITPAVPLGNGFALTQTPKLSETTEQV